MGELPLYDNKALGEALSELGIIDKKDLEEALKTSKDRKVPLGEILLSRDLISDENFGRVVAEMLSTPYIRLDTVSIPERVLRIVPEIVARKQRIVVFAKDSGGVKLAMNNPKNREIVDFIAKKTGDKVSVFFATPQDMDRALELYKKELQQSFDELLKGKVEKVVKDGPGEVPATEIVDLLIEYAQTNGASDVHIEPRKKESVVRFRIDGVMHDVLDLPGVVHEQVVTRIKVAAKLRTDEHLSAQDGKMQMEISGTEDLDIRVSIVPVVYGEKVVMRLLSSRSRQFGLADLGMNESDLAKVKRGYGRPFGMVLSTGPTGSGKTTTIYSILKLLNSDEVNIATIEDPVEYDIEGVNQIQVNPKTNLTFAAGLRAILRQDPNVIFVGEIRDEETADIAVNSAMTGHLVLSTLHTNDAATTLPRLLDMGIEPFLVASTINVIIAQRLVRKICLKCRVSEDVEVATILSQFPQASIKEHFKGRQAIRIYKGKGCQVCHMTGYVGRVGIYEILEISEGIREMVVAKADAGKINQRAVKEGMRSMLEDGLDKVQRGITTIDEVLRATRE